MAGPVRTTSIATLVVVLLVPVATAVLVISGGFDYVRASRSEQEAIRTEGNQLAEELSVSLQLPVWNFDRDQILAVMGSVMENPDVFALVVRLADTHTTTYVLGRDRAWTVVPAAEEPGSTGMTRQERSIKSAGETVGTVTVIVTPKFAQQRLRARLFLAVGTVLILDLALVLALFVLLWRIVLRPLRLVEWYAVGVSREQRSDYGITSAKFRGELERLRGAISSMVGMLDSRYTALRRSESDLARSRDDLALRNEELTLLNERLRESELRYREIFETTSDGIFVVDVADGLRFRLAACNPAQERMLGISADSVLGRFLEEYLPKETADVLGQDNRACVTAGIPMSFERTITTPSGQRFFSTILIPVPDAAGTIRRIIGVARDVTEGRIAAAREREHEKQLFQAAKLASLGTLVSGIAHEINNPNNFIRLNSQSLQELWKEGRLALDHAVSLDGDLALHGLTYGAVRGMVDELLAGIGEGSKRIEKLLVNLRDFARGDEGDLSADVDVNAVIASGVMIIRNLIEKATRRFAVHAAPFLPPLRGNAQQIEQVVINLVTNACQALRSRDDAVTVSTSLDTADGTILVEVRDEGIGIPSQNLERVIDPFFTTRQANGGTGLGLAVSSRIVSNHGGTMRFHSTDGRGTVVSVRFPVQVTSR